MTVAVVLNTACCYLIDAVVVVAGARGRGRAPGEPRRRNHYSKLHRRVPNFSEAANEVCADEELNRPPCAGTRAKQVLFYAICRRA